MSKVIQYIDENKKKIYPKVKNDYILVNLNQRQYVASDSRTKVNFNTVLDCHGNGLELYNGGVKIGKGISKIRVDLTLWLEAYGGYSAWFLYKNSSDLTYNLFPGFSSGEIWRTGNSFVYTSVEEGDVIYAYVRFSVANPSNNIAGNYQKSCMMGVQVIE